MEFRNKGPETMSDHWCDVCIFCAMPDEAEAVLDVFFELGEAAFQPKFSRRKREYRLANIPNKLEEPLRVLVSWQPKYGPTQGLLHFQDMLDEFRPRFAAMTGICAGDRDTVALG